MDRLSFITIGKKEVPLAFDSFDHAWKVASHVTRENPNSQFYPRLVSDICEGEYKNKLAKGEVKSFEEEMVSFVRRQKLRRIAKYTGFFLTGGGIGFGIVNYLI